MVPYLVSVGTKSSQKTTNGITLLAQVSWASASLLSHLLGLLATVSWVPPPPNLSSSAGSLSDKAPGVGVLELLLEAAREPVLMRPHPQSTASPQTPSAALATPAELEPGASAAWDHPQPPLPLHQAKPTPHCPCFSVSESSLGPPGCPSQSSACF